MDTAEAPDGASAALIEDWPNTQVQFDPATQHVTLTVPLEDAPRDYFPDAAADGEKVEEVAGFQSARDSLERSLQGIGSPPLSESKLYDA